MTSVEGYTKLGADAAFAPIGHTHEGMGGGAGLSPKAAHNFPSGGALTENRNAVGTNPFRYLTFNSSLDDSGWENPFGVDDPTTWISDAVQPGTPTISVECWYQYELFVLLRWATDPGWARLSAYTSDGNAAGFAEITSRPMQSNASSTAFETFMHLTSGPIHTDGGGYFPINIQYGDVDKTYVKLVLAVTRLT